MKILYFEKKQDQLYYKDFFDSIQKKHKIYLNKTTDDVDLIVYGYGWVCDGNLDYAINNTYNNSNSIPSVLILNKEYKNMDKKKQFIKQNNIQLVFTPHHRYKEWEQETGVKFLRFPFAAHSHIFKNYNNGKKYDLGFTGNLFNDTFYKSGIMGKYFNNIRERISNELKKDDYKKLSLYLNGGKYIKGTDYGSLINSSKIWLCTPSATELVGPRFYEIMGACSLLFCRESFAYENLFEPGKHCVTFKDDLSDFKEKLFYYIENNNERNDIIKNANKHFLNNHTWDHRVNQFTNQIEKYIK